MKTGSFFDQCLPDRAAPAAQPKEPPRADLDVRLELTGADPAHPDADLLARTEGILRAAHEALGKLRARGMEGEAEALLELGRLLGACARRRRSREECNDL